MRKETRALFNGYVSQIALLNSIPADDVAKKFSVEPAVEQRLEDRIRESSEFLMAINMVPVMQQSGQKIGIGAGRRLAGRVDTSGGTRRNPAAIGDSNIKHEYKCEKTNFDWSRRYEVLDAWRHRPDFEALIRDDIVHQQALDRICIGWHGEEVAATTHLGANPLLQDVNKGWLFHIREEAPAQVLDDGALTVNDEGGNNAALKAIYVQAGAVLFDPSLDNAVTAEADYSSLDALVLDAKRLIHETHRGDTDLVVIVGHDLVDDKYFNIAQKTGATATEVEATDRIIRSEKMLGGLPAMRVSSFPANALLITKLSNLSIYWQEDTRRRQLVDEPEFDRIANYESVNEAYVVEEYEIAALVENIVMGKAPARPAAP
ncbi:MAG: P2 family phage major capsid protein [Porphyrobacter sp.]|nr:P2 family phage major capsid protein [Porphyrobacter sp.]